MKTRQYCNSEENIMATPPMKIKLLIFTQRTSRFVQIICGGNNEGKDIITENAV